MAHEIGATLTLRDNMSATLRGVRNEQSAFRRDVQATQRTLRQQMQVRLDATAATRTISRIRTAIEPLRNRIVTQIAIRDNAARERRRIQNELNALGRRAIAPLVSIRNTASSVIGSISSKLAVLRAAAAVPIVIATAVIAGGAVALKSGAELEQQQISMKHFIGVNNQGKSDAEVTRMRDSYITALRKNADETPFSTSEVIGAGSRAVNVMGGDTKGAMDLVKLAGNMAALNPGKTISDSMEALADAKNGEMERLKEFGFKVSADEFKGYAGKGKNDDMSESDTKTAYGMLVNKQLNPYFKGGSEKLAQSGTGLMSTITGNLGSKVQDTGLKMLEKLKPVLISVIGMIDKYSPQMDKLGLKIADGIGFAVSKLPVLKQHLKDAFEAAQPAINWLTTTGFPAVRDLIGGVWDKAKGVYDFFKTNWSTLVPFIEGIAISFGIYKGVMMAIEFATIAVTAAQLALNFAMNANPMGLYITLIGLAIGAGILLYKNWDTVSAKASEVGTTIGNAFKSGINIAIDAINWLTDKLNGVLGLIGVKIPSVAHIALSTSSNSTADGMQAVRGVDGDHATGLSVVPFDGYIAKLHKGERVQTANENPYNGGGSSGGKPAGGNKTEITIYAKGITGREVLDEVLPELKLALQNM